MKQRLNNFKMFVITHKKIFYKINNKDYIPLQVGNGEKIDDNYLRDNTGDNISNQNPNYCELTGIYWLWRNYNLPEYVGICHYRRFLVKRFMYNLVDEKYVNKNLKKYDVILPYQYNTKSTVKEHFINSTSGRKNDIDRLDKLIKEKYNEFYDDYTYIMNSRYASYDNIAIMNKNLFNQYCTWLFDVLFEFAKDTDLTGYTKQEARIYGFLSEFLLNVWVRHENLKIKYCNSITVEEKKHINFLKRCRCMLFDLVRFFKRKL